ncbi:MAG: DUF11 domain-containing protein, partial [Candidatus Bipolaricaulota bacterium]
MPAHALPFGRKLLPVALLLAPILLFGLTASAQFPSCNWGCPAQDIAVDDVWLGDAGGTPIGEGFCTAGDPETVYIWATIRNNSQGTRYAVWSVFDLYTNGAYEGSYALCLEDTVAGGATFDAIMATIQWRCKDVVQLQDFVISFASTPTTCADTPECRDRRAKCEGPLTMFLTPSTADLAVYKEAEPDPVLTGELLTFTITVENLGPEASTFDVTVSETIPENTSYDSSSASAGTYDPSTGFWWIGDLLVGDSETLTLTVRVDPGYTGTLTNTATVSSGLNDPNLGNNTASTSTTVLAAADLELSKTVDNPTPDVGTDVTFTVTVTNLGPSEATGVEVIDELPSGYSYVSSIASQGTYTSGTGVWEVGSLADGATATLDITATVLASGDYTNTATVAGDENDPVPGNNTDSATTNPVPQADLELSKTVDNPTPDVGTDVTFTVTVTNLGPSEATGVEVIDELPS